ncbi:hypothetical protein RIF29_42041 [Crotalaria pallida]|uniref:Uncharacterized protein n=1 Tax=Crotalaria pallida TaxID=3830 RepID=A0AAN9E6L2_CROPI
MVVPKIESGTSDFYVLRDLLHDHVDYTTASTSYAGLIKKTPSKVGLQHQVSMPCCLHYIGPAAEVQLREDTFPPLGDRTGDTLGEHLVNSRPTREGRKLRDHTNKLIGYGRIGTFERACG